MKLNSEIRIGEWVVHPDAGRITRGSDQVRLPPHAMGLLVYMASRAGEVVSIEEMIAEVWQGKPMTSGSVYNSLNQLRQALGDDSRKPEYIENIPKRGYRLIARVEFDHSPDELRKAEPPRSTHLRSAALLILGFFVLAFLVINWPGSQPDPGGHIPVNPEKSIAVLPFTDLSPGGDQGYFARGVSEQILNGISVFPDLKVVGRTSSFAFEGVDRDMREIGRQLGVAYLLEGSVRRDGDELRVTVQLIEADEGIHVWSEEFSGKVGQVFRIQDQIAESIASELKLAVLDVSDAINTQEVASNLVDISTYDLLLLARDRINRASLTELEEAVLLLQQALEIEPDYAAAHAELAFAWVTLTNDHPWQYPRQEWAVKDGPIMHHARRALELDPTMANAQFALGSILQLARNSTADVEEAESAFRRALELNPNHARSQLWLSGNARIRRESWQRRLEPARRAMELEPLWPTAKRFYLTLIEFMPEYRQEKWELIRQLKASDASPEQLQLYRRRELRSLAYEGRFAEAINLAESFIDVATYGSDFQETYINMFYLIGAPDEIPEEFEWRPLQMAVHFPGSTEVGNVSYEDICVLADENRTPVEYIICSYEELLRGNTRRAQIILEENLSVGLMDFQTFKSWHRVLNTLRSPAITLATIHKLSGRQDLAMAYAEIEQEILDSESENGAIESPLFSRTRARLHALRGENELAIDELEKLIDTGRTSFRVFMHPVFNDLRGNPRYEALKAHWMDLINAERAKLGFGPLTLNPNAGPGVLPFMLHQGDLRSK